MSITTGSPATDGRNTMGTVRSCTIESSTTAGLYIDGDDTYGRFVLTDWYGDKVDIRNVDNLRVYGNEFHAANNWAGNSNEYFFGNNIAGAGDRPADTYELA